MKNIVVGSFKGGVGKSTIALNLAYLISLEYKTLLIDTDPQNSLAYFLCKDFEVGFSELLANKVKLTEIIQKPLDDNKNFHFIPNGVLSLEKPNSYEELFTKENLSNILSNLEEYDFILYDTPPRISLQTEVLLDLSDSFIVVLNPDPATYSSFMIFKEFIESKGLKDKVYVLVNKIEPTKISEDFYKIISYNTKEKNLGLIAYDINVLESQGHCKPTVVYNKDSPFSIYLKKALEKYFMQERKA